MEFQLFPLVGNEATKQLRVVIRILKLFIIWSTKSNNQNRYYITIIRQSLNGEHGELLANPVFISVEEEENGVMPLHLRYYDKTIWLAV